MVLEGCSFLDVSTAYCALGWYTWCCVVWTKQRLVVLFANLGDGVRAFYTGRLRTLGAPLRFILWGAFLGEEEGAITG